MSRNSATYIILFAGAVCVVCSFLVSTAATVLRDRQDANVQLDRQTKILLVSGLLDETSEVTPEEVQRIFDERITPRVVNLETSEIETDPPIDPAIYDQQRAMGDPEMSKEAPKNPAQVARIPTYSVIYEVLDEEGNPDLYVFPIEGKGLWSTLYGFLALDSDLDTVRGLTYYKHGETPGLGGEVDNPSWKSKWPGREIYDESDDVAIEVIKGSAPPPEEAPFKVDGLSGATLTARGVTHMLHFWMGENGFGPLIDKLRTEGSAT